MSTFATFGATLTAVSAAASDTAKKAVEHSAEHAGAGIFPPLNTATYPSQLFWLAITFGILLFLLSRVLLPRLSGILEERSNRIADDLDSAARMQREAEAAGKAYEQSLADARAKAHNVAETTRASVTSELDAEMQVADEQAAKQLAQAEIKIQKTRAAALSNVDDIATETTQAIVQHLFAKKFSLAAVRKAVKAFG
ncbi:MAG: F0F1 ATP synthase subunit B' [Robiginitomaculum sp.]|nr:F0F1 ATP synthase subunit B' [Robiginitomaculum sp.]